VALSGFGQWCGVRAGGLDDPDASRAAALIGAYFDAEQARACRRRVWRLVALGALIAWTLIVTTSALTIIDLVFGATLLGAAAVASAVAEWRARKKLEVLWDPACARGIRL
jgi:hypothetical protein